jgi:uncharacterized protein
VEFSPLRLAALFVGGFVAGSINSIAGGGSLITFPALLGSGLGQLAANGTNTVALIPGSAAAFLGYRDTLAGDRRLVLSMALPSAVGGLAGATLALSVGDAVFARLVPWLILLATALFAAQEPLTRAVRARTPDDVEAPLTSRRLASLAAFQLVVALYGGFFGAGIGILMLAALTLMGVRDVHRANGLKNLAAVCINGVASVTFIANGTVRWVPAVAVMLGASAGGFGGAGLARRVGQKAVRRAVMLVGLSMTVAMFARAWRG